MKFALFAAALLALASAPTYSKLNTLFDSNIVLVGALAPGITPLLAEDEPEKPSVVALAE